MSTKSEKTIETSKLVFGAVELERIMTSWFSGGDTLQKQVFDALNAVSNSTLQADKLQALEEIRHLAETQPLVCASFVLFHVFLTTNQI